MQGSMQRNPVHGWKELIPLPAGFEPGPLA